MRKLVLGLVIFGGVFLIGCHPPSAEVEKIVQESDGRVSRFHDEELKVTCWAFTRYNRGGISCILDRDLGR